MVSFASCENIGTADHIAWANLFRSRLSLRKYPHQYQECSQYQSEFCSPGQSAFHNHQSSGFSRRLNDMILPPSFDPAQSK